MQSHLYASVGNAPIECDIHLWAINGPNMIEVMMVQNKPKKKHFEKSQTLKRRSKHIRAQFRGNNNPLRYNLHV